MTGLQVLSQELLISLMVRRVNLCPCFNREGFYLCQMALGKGGAKFLRYG